MPHTPETYVYENGLNQLLCAAKVNRPPSNISAVLYQLIHNDICLTAGTCETLTCWLTPPRYKGQLLPTEGAEAGL